MKIFIVGINGKMGRAICDCAEREGVTVAGGLDIAAGGKYPVFAKAADVNVGFDVIIDFSRPATLGEVTALAEKHGAPVVLATTGYSEVAESVLPALASALKGFDVEIVEAHHNRKVDAPSGTALQMLESVKKGLDYEPRIVYGREGSCKREKGDIGVHAIRGGTIVGEHTVMFVGEDEIVEIKHTALSRNIFAEGAVKAAAFLIGKAPGMYDMNDYING